MQPLLHIQDTLHGDPDQGLQPAGKGGIYILFQFFSTRIRCYMPQPWLATRFFKLL